MTIYILLLILSINNIGLFTYIKNQLKVSNIYENYYVNPKNIKYEFPDNKRNLIYIYMESLESSYAHNTDKISYIPNLQIIALDSENVHFSNNNSLGGATDTYGTNWTVASLIAQTSGIPLNISINGNSYGGFNKYLPGTYSLGEILKNGGYKNYFLLGSDAKFGHRDEYFTSHGDYEILDYNWAINTKQIPHDYHEWWGYEDEKLFSFAKTQLLSISKNNEPFNFTILTADTHFPDGYMDNDCKKTFDTDYANSINCFDKKINDFILWIKKQDFYNNTTIILTGDHLTMNSGEFISKLTTDRKVYNAIINSPLEAKNTKNRIFSVIDMFPTTLASLNIKYKSKRLGLGTNLYTKEKTLMEKIGANNFNVELSKKSNYYNKYILGDTYIEMEYKNY